MKLSSRGFTFVELLVTISLLAICVIPVLQMFSTCLEQGNLTGDSTSARYFLQQGMERVRNSGYTEKQLENIGDFWDPPLEKPAFAMNKALWRTLRQVKKGSDPLKVTLTVYREVLDSKGKMVERRRIVDAQTLVEDLDWPQPE